MVHTHSRWPAGITLLAVLLLGGVPLFGLRSNRGVGDEGELMRLQLAIAQADAKPGVWLQYGQKLQNMGRYQQAVLAYRRYLENDPYDRQTRLQCANCLINVGDKDEFYAFMQGMLAIDPKLTLEVLTRPDVQGFMTEGRFQALHKESIAQSMD